MAEPAKKEPYDVDAERGIQNATSRFKRQREGELLSEQLMKKADAGRSTHGETNGTEDVNEQVRSRKPKSGMGGSALVQMREAGEALLQVSKEHDLGYTQQDADAVLQNVPQTPPFPALMVGAALLKDIVDAADVTGVGILLTTVLSFLISIIIFIWFLGKMSGMQRWLWKRYVIVMVIEFIPILKIIPTTTILVLAAHYRETKIVRMINAALERIPGTHRSR